MWFNFCPLRRTIAALLAAAGLACAAAPAAEQLQAIAPGVSVLGVHLGGLTAQPAETASIAAELRPSDRDRLPARDVHDLAGASSASHASVDAAVRAALAATPQSRIGLPVAFSSTPVGRSSTSLARGDLPRPAETRPSSAPARRFGR